MSAVPIVTSRPRRLHERSVSANQILSTGFDAPKTDLLLIARQVLSPVRYMQMVGRALRGTANGGKETCRIVTVLDNLDRFAELHLDHYCEPHFGDGEHLTAKNQRPAAPGCPRQVTARVP